MSADECIAEVLAAERARAAAVVARDATLPRRWRLALFQSTRVGA